MKQKSRTKKQQGNKKYEVTKNKSQETTIGQKKEPKEVAARILKP